MTLEFLSALSASGTITLSHGATLTPDGTLVAAYVANGKLTIARATATGGVSATTLATGVATASLGGDGDLLSTCFVDGSRNVYACDSVDGGSTWSAALYLGAAGVGTAGPYVVRRGDAGWASWVVSSVTDGVGALQFAARTASGWTQETSTGIATAINAAIAIDPQGGLLLCWRDERVEDGSTKKTVRAASWYENALAQGYTIRNGYDPDVVCEATRTTVASHNQGIVTLDTWDGSGINGFACNPGKGSKFGALGAGDGVRAALCSGYPTTTEATNSKASDSTRTVLLYIDTGSGWSLAKPAGDATGQLSPIGVAVQAGRVAAAWKTSTGFAFAGYRSA